MTAPLREHLKTTFKVAITLTLSVWAFSKIDFATLRDRLTHANFELLFFSAVILVVGGFAGAGSWFCVLRTRLGNLTYREVAACHWSGMFFNSFLLSNVGGDVVKGYIVARDQGQTGFVVTSLLLDRAINLGMLLCIGIFTYLIHLGRLVWAIAFLVLLAMFLIVAITSARFLRDHFCRNSSAGMKRKLAALAEPVFDLMLTPSLLVPTLLAAFVSQFFKTWQNVFIILALGLVIPTFRVWYVIPLFGVISALPISIGGLGPREMAAQHLGGTDMLLLSLAGHLTVVLVNTLGVIPFLFAKQRKKG